MDRKRWRGSSFREKSVTLEKRLASSLMASTSTARIPSCSPRETTANAGPLVPEPVEGFVTCRLQVCGQYADIDFEEIRELPNHLPTEGLLACEDF